MKKMFKALSVLALALSLAASASPGASAGGINSAERMILDELHTTVTMAGVEKSLPAVYINQTENYLNTVDLTDDEASEIIIRIESVKSYLTSTGAANYNGLSDSQIEEFFALCQDVVGIIHLKIAYDKATRVVTIVDENGSVIFSTQLGGSGGHGDPADPNPIKPTGYDLSIPGVFVAAGTGILLVSAAGVYLFRAKKKAENHA